MILILNLFIMLMFNAHSQQCPREEQSLSATEKMHKIAFGVKCDALNKDTWDPSWNNPCDCLHQQSLYSKLKRRVQNKDQQKKLSNINKRLEKKVADIFKTQIFTQLEQSLRLDIYLKKGIISTSSVGRGSDNTITFPESCRIDKVGELVENLYRPEAKCTNPRMKERLKLLFGESTDPKKTVFQNWKDSQMKLFEKTVMNKLSDEDRKEGLCIPYKSFLSLNSDNNLRTTYLKIAKANKNNFKAFQSWASNRIVPSDVFNIIGINDDAHTNVEPTTRNDIRRLIKTDPVFERMIRDPQFFESITKEDIESFSPNDPSVIKSIAESQNRQCKQMYGKLSNNEKKQISISRSSGQSVQLSESSEKNLLTKFLCEEDFPRSFLDKDVITNILAPEFKDEFKDENEASDYLVDYLYCQDRDTQKRNLQSSEEIVSADMSNSFQGIPKNDDIKNLLNFTLSPKSDLEESGDPFNRENEYKSFNQSVCEFIEDKCKKNDLVKKIKLSEESDLVEEGDLVEDDALSCSIERLSTTIAQKIISKGFPLEMQDQLIKQIFDSRVSDKELRGILSGPKYSLSRARINLIVTLRHQNKTFVFSEVIADLRKAKVDIPQNYSLLQLAHISLDVQKNPNIRKELKNRFIRGEDIRTQNSIISETQNEEDSSYFSNYFVLANSTDETHISNDKKQEGVVGVVQGLPVKPTPSSASSGVQASTQFPGSPVDVPPSSGFIYERKNFGAPNVPAPMLEDKKLTVNPPKEKASEPPPPPQPKAEVAAEKKSKNQDLNLGLVTPAPLANSGNSDFKFTLSIRGSSSTSQSNNPIPSIQSSYDPNEAEKMRQIKELRDKLAAVKEKIADMKKAKENESSSAIDDEFSKVAREQKRLKDELAKAKAEANAFKPQRGRSESEDRFADTRSDSATPESFVNTDSKTFNNGYDRGEEFNQEKARNQIDDGSKKFDPAQASKAKAVVAGGSGASESEKNPGLSFSSSSLKGVRAGSGQRPGGARNVGITDLETSIALKCGTGSILKCVFPNSYFTDEKLKNRLYTIIANLKLEGRKFQGLEKIRKSRSQMKAGENYKVTYYLYTYDLVLNDKMREVTNEEREIIFKDIKKNRGDPLFKAKLIQYRKMTKLIPPRAILNDEEALSAIKRTITKEDYEALQD